MTIESRTLQHTDLRVSRLSFGNMTFGSQTDEAAARRVVDRLLDAETVTACDAVRKRLRGITPKYNR